MSLPLASASNPFRSGIRCLRISFILALLVPAIPAHAWDEMREIIENVRANEELYKNIDIVVRRTYKLGTPKHTRPGYTAESTAITRTVFQDGLLYYRNDETAKTLGEKEGSFGSQNLDTLQGFDGHETRVAEQHGFANLYKSRHEDYRLFRPHVTFLLEESMVGFPLSAYLAGGTKSRSQFATGPYSRSTLVARDMGPDEVAGLRCRKIAVESWQDGFPREKGELRYLWLAIDRNYLPVKVLVCLSLRQPETFIMTAEASDFRELEPGVWLPFSARVVMNDPSYLKDEKRVVLNHEVDYHVESVTLSPHNDLKLFQDIPFPHACPVYELEGNKIVRSYLQGAKPDAKRGRSRWWTLALVGGGVIVCSLVALMVYRRRQPIRVAAWAN